ncbi:MAG TPA: TetR/AcrR family transcriptional regulator, partial [Acidimicrobiales bacterium]|nr:TetR/AcrR family transcriptional regulator [Acidimicrobiales bacterium]
MARPPTAADPDAIAVPTRRAPFGDRPTVGSRGLRTQQRVLDAALEAFGEVGYDRATLDRVAQIAGCSRITIYQYFSGKEDVFRHLAAQMARQVRASLEAIEPVTPDAEGLAALRSWIGRYAAVRARYEPVLRVVDAAATSDPLLAGGLAQTIERHVGIFESRVQATDLPPRLLDPTVELLLTSVDRALGLAAILQAAAPASYTHDRVEVALADVTHRVLFGLRPSVNAHEPAGEPPPALHLGPAMAEIFERVDVLAAEGAAPGRRALAAMLEVGDAVVAGRGYRGLRVDDVVEAAGVSRGS